VHGTDRDAPSSMPSQTYPTPLDAVNLVTVIGGASQTASQQQLRTMAQQYCPVVYAQNKAAPMITRKMGEACLDEAGYGMFKGQLDKYFPRK